MDVLNLVLSLRLFLLCLLCKQQLKNDSGDKDEDRVCHKEQGAEHIIEPDRLSIVELQGPEYQQGEVVHQNQSGEELYAERLEASGLRQFHIEGKHRIPEVAEDKLQNEDEESR